MITLSSGEAELYDVVKAAAQAKDLCSLMADFGYETKVTVHIDSTAATRIVCQMGFGKTRRIDVQYLWVQDNVKP